MKQEALLIASAAADPTARLNVLREYVQAFVLRSLSESEAFRSLSFVGGTALRFLHGLPRFSEDLDFSLEDPAGYRPADWLGKLGRDLALAGFDASVSWSDRRAVHAAWVRVSGILRDARLDAMPDQKLAVKLEIDSRPPAGAKLATTIVRRHVMFAVRVHDLESLMAGKVHALWTRRYAKGRDWYDLLWYRSRKPPVEPNLTLLAAALAQTHPELAPRADAWANAVAERASRLDAERLAEDVFPFLERAADVSLLRPEALAALLREGAG